MKVVKVPKGIVRAGLLLIVVFTVTVVSADTTPVTVRPLEELEFYPVRDAPATVISLNDSHVSAEISGVLNSLRVRVGDSVSKGDLIATVECDDYDITVDEAKANYDSGVTKYNFIMSQLKKAKKLSKKKNISSEEVERRRSNLSIQKSEVARLRAVLKAAQRSREKCSIHAPLNAVVIERLANLGDYLTPGSKIARLLDQENIEVSAKVQEQDLLSLEQAHEMTFVTPEHSYPLKLRTVLPLLESRIRSYEVRLEFAGDRATPGSAGRLQWKLPDAHMPADALVRLGSKVGIFLEEDGVARFRPLEQAEEGRPAKLGSLQEGKVIVEGRFNIEDGDHVEVVGP